MEFLAISSIQPSRRSLANDAVHQGINGPLAPGVEFQAPGAPRQTGVAVLSKRFAVDNAEVLLPAIRMMKKTAVFFVYIMAWLSDCGDHRLGASRSTKSA